MSFYPYGLVSPQRSVYPQAYYPQSIPQQRQAPYSMPSQQVFRPPPPVIRPPPQHYYPQYQKPTQFAPTNYGQSPVKPQSSLQQSYPINQQNQRYPNSPPQVFNQQQQPLTRPTVPQYQYQIPTQQRGTAQYYYQPQQQQLQKQQPQQYSQNKMVSPPPKQSSQQQLPTQTKPQSPPTQQRPQSQQQQHQQVPQQQINKPPQQQKQPQLSQKDDDLEKKFQDAIDRTRDLVQKYQNPQQKQPQQPQVQEQHPNPQDNDDQLQELALQYEDGYIYRGQGFEPATREGYGILTDQNDNTVYDGQWKDNQYHGQGKLINVQAEQIEGPFDYQDLSAIENGWLGYEGEFSEGKMNGFGRLQLTNGEVFEGQFNDGMIHGEGIFSALNDQTIKGLWQEGVLTQVFA
ncbi:unnamed protein product [Paramecium sonneborni]|uniref:MORN repeat protein n=1 Tax=Paramecium sonneborni TaxID=65129 RepID=A0A8S1LJG5_9CILI|nr:unnamed protein product [Paramecium sonneborni]